MRLKVENFRLRAWRSLQIARYLRDSEDGLFPPGMRSLIPVLVCQAREAMHTYLEFRRLRQARREIEKAAT